MSDTIEIDEIEFDAADLIRAINENLTKATEISAVDDKTTGLTVHDGGIVIDGDSGDDPDGYVIDIDSAQKTVHRDLAMLRKMAEDELRPTTREYLRDMHTLYDANDVILVEESPIINRKADAVIKHESDTTHYDSRLKPEESEAINDDDRVSIGPIRAKDDALYVGIVDSQ